MDKQEKGRTRREVNERREDAEREGAKRELSLAIIPSARVAVVSCIETVVVVIH